MDALVTSSDKDNANENMRKKQKSKKAVAPERKAFHGQINCTCNNKCADKIDILQQKEIFTKYSSLNSWSSKVSFIRAMVKTTPVKEDLNPVNQLKKRHKISKYYIGDHEKTQHQVCLHFIVKLLQVNRTKIFRALTQTTDRRGKYPHRKANFSDVEFMKSFIRKFPTFESHFNSSSTGIKYLHPNLNFQKMYDLYVDHCTLFDKRVSSKSFFRKILKANFNLTFMKKEKKSECSQCKFFDKKLKPRIISSDFRAKMEEKKQIHVNVVTNIKKDFVETTNFPNENADIFTFQMCKTQQLPSLSLNETVLRRPLWFFIFLIYNEVTNEIYAYVWNESTASRGSEEISSCLYRHFSTQVSNNTKNIILFCNPMRGQNRNMKISLMLKKFVADAKLPNLECIEQRFFASGHTYNSCDRSFALIEKRKSAVGDIFTQEGWIDVISTSKKNEPKFHVLEMSKEHFYSSKTLENLLISLKTSADEKKIKWSSYQNIKYDHNSFELNVLKYGNDENSYRAMLLKQKGLCALKDTQLRILYQQNRKIDSQKYDDLQQLMSHIPECHHSFYTNLEFVNNDTSKTDFALAIRQSDDEEEE